MTATTDIEIPDRETSQSRLDRLAAGTLGHRPSQAYTVADRIEERACDSGGKPFVLFDERSVGYAELDRQANRVARLLHERVGLVRGDVAGLMMENRPEYVAAWAGMAKLGVTAALINSNLSGRALEHALAASGSRTLLAGSECTARLASLSAEDLTTVEVGDAGNWGPAFDGLSDEGVPSEWRQGLVAGDDLFHVFTSGTTGLPKAARLSHMRFLGVGDGMSETAGYGPDDVIACVLPLYHGAAGMVVVSSALAQGAAIALRNRFSASAFWDDARRYGVTGCQYIGEICRYLLNQPPRDNDREHTVRVMMGAGLAPDLWAPFKERFGIERIIEGWSSTEANTSLINLDGVPGACGRIPFPDRHNGRLVRYDVEGELYPRSEDDYLVECGPGEAGEFIGRILDLGDSGAGRFEGYTSDEDTEAKILRNVFEQGDAWYRSGDLLLRDENDYYYFVDRIGDTFRWKSENVSTQEVAEALAGFPGLLIANVYGVKVPGNEGRAGMAALVLADPAIFDGAAFYRHARARLPDYAVPMFIRLSEEPDMTTTFKLRKIELVRQGYDSALVDDPLFVRDDDSAAYVPVGAEGS